MSLIPIFFYPTGNPIDPPSGNVIYKWGNFLGGEKLDGPLTFGSNRPDNTLAHNAIATFSNGVYTIEYY